MKNENLNELVKIMNEYKVAKFKAEEEKLKLNQIAFNLGLNQKSIGKINVFDFLDGYLVANGIVQEYRKND
jgi:hypothetical protein